MRRLTSLLCTAVLLVCCGESAAAQPATHDSGRNLLAAMQLWGDIKLFDPQIADGKVDWDAAFMNAEPAIAAATTAHAYEAAIASMVAPLHDPATHVSDAAASPNDVAAISRLTAVKRGDAVLVTVHHGAGTTDEQFSSDASAAVELAAKSDVIAIDLRGVNEANAGDDAALAALFWPQSPFAQLVSGTLTLPRQESRSYLGYPNQNQENGYQGYSSSDSITDGVSVSGTSKVKHRFVFLVDAGTSLPSMALALVSAGDATIYTAGGSPSIQAPSTVDMPLPYGLVATYRTSDLPDIQQPLSLPAASNLQNAIAQGVTPQDFSRANRQPERAFQLESRYESALFPAEPMRMLAIARIYNVIRYFSPYVDLMHDDWNAVARQGIADEAVATDARSYVLGLMKFYAHLHDSHGSVVGPAVTAEFGAGVPFESRYLHGQAVVTQIATGYAVPRALQRGDAIDAVDGIPTRQAMKSIERYINASTPQGADYAALRPAGNPSVFAGKKGAPITLTVRDRVGNRHVVKLNRGFYSFPADRSGPKYFVLPGNVGYVDFDRLNPSEVDAMFEALKNTRAIVFDNRGYPRGTVWAIAPRLTTASHVRAALFDTPLVASPLDVQLGDARFLPIHRTFVQLLPAANGWRYLKPTVMLVDERSISQSEHSALFFRAAAHTRFVGTPTIGADGDVTSMVVPGGMSLWFSGEGVRYPDGTQLQRIGIIPKVRVEPTAVDIATGNDVVLQQGLAEALMLAGSTPASRRAAVAAEIARERRPSADPVSPQALAVAGQNAQALKLPWVVKGANYAGTSSAGAGYQRTDEITLNSTGASTGGANFGSFSAALDIDAYRGKTIRIRGYLSAKDVAVRGGAGFWLRIDGPEVQFDNMQDRWLTGTGDWKPFAIVLRVPTNATQAYCGLLLVGPGTARASGLTIDVVPDSTPTTDD